MTVTVQPNPKFKYLLPNTNKLAVGAKLFTYDVGTTNKKTSYKDFNKNTANTNPIILDANAECDLWLDGKTKLVLAPSNDTDPPASPYDTFDYVGEESTDALTVGIGNKIPNGGFEIDSNGDAVPDNWTFTPNTDNTISLETADTIEGTRAVKFVIGGSLIAEMSSDAFKVQEGLKDLLAFSLKTSVATSSVTIRIKWLDNTGTFLSNTDLYDNLTTNPIAWTDYAFEFTPPVGARSAQIIVKAGVNGSTVRVDNFRTQIFEHDSVDGVDISGDWIHSGDPSFTGLVEFTGGLTKFGSTAPEDGWTRDALEIAANGGLSADGTDVVLSENAYYDGDWRYKDTDKASRLKLDGDSFSVDQANSSTEDTAIVWINLFKAIRASTGAAVAAVGAVLTYPWLSSRAVMQVGDTGSISGEKTAAIGNTLSVSQNAYEAAGTWAYKVTDKASQYVQDGGEHVWNAVATGTTLNPITWTEVMKAGLSANGAEVLSVGKSTIEDWHASYSTLQIGGNATLMANQTEAASTEAYLLQNAYYDGTWKYVSTDEASFSKQSGGVHRWDSAASGTADTAITWTETMRTGLSSNGSEVLSIGKNSFESWGSVYMAAQFGGNASIMANQTEGANNIFFNVHNAYFDGSNWKYIVSDEASYSSQRDGTHQWFTAAAGTAGNTVSFTEVMRTDTNGSLLVGKTSASPTTAGVELQASGETIVTRSGASPMKVNRLASDGSLITFQQSSSTEGSISVSGTTVSYNSFCGGHWSQLETNHTERSFEKGMVVETIDEMCEWLDEDGNPEDNDQLVRFKPSDTVGSKRVYGIFSNWDEDDDYNDAIIHAIGATQILVTGKCKGGDLLISNGDGTARVQEDDLIRSSTIGKVTMGSKEKNVKLVPCVLYCG